MHRFKLTLVILLLTSSLACFAQRATPDAPDQSELLKNSKDKDYILRNFKTMYVATKDIDFFDCAQMKAALHRN